MKTSMDFFNEFVEAHNPGGQKALQQLTGASQPLVSSWKIRGGMTPAATVKVGMALGYPSELCYQIAAIEAERTETGRKFLATMAHAAATIATMAVVGTVGVVVSGIGNNAQAQVARPAGIEPATPAFGGQWSTGRIRSAVYAARRRATALARGVRIALSLSPKSALAGL